MGPVSCLEEALPFVFASQAARILTYNHLTRPFGLSLSLSVFVPWQDDKVVKKVKVQRDYFERSPMMQQIPILGQIYNSYPLRFLLGNAQAGLFHFLQALATWILPKRLHGRSGCDVASKDQ